MKLNLRQGTESAALSAALERIENYPFAQVKEKLETKGVVFIGGVDAAIAEFRKYLALIARGHRNVGMVSKEVDEVWHTFILFTRDYTEFCREVFGSYLHHQPALPSRPIGRESRERFLEVYRSEFGAVPAIWGETRADCSPDTGGGGNECCPDPSCSGEPDPTFVPTAGVH